MFEGLNQTQKKEMMRQLGAAQGVSPEGMEHAADQYLKSLQQQAEVAKSFYFGRIEEGFEGLYDLPDDVRIEIDGLIWEAAGGVAIDPTALESQSLIAASILHSIEMRMGMHDSK